MTKMDIFVARLEFIILVSYFGLFLYTWEIGRFLHPR